MCDQTYPRSSICRLICLDPYDVFTPPEAPLCEDLAPSLESLAGAAADPHEDERGVRRERGHGHGLEVLPCERRGEGGIDEDDIKLCRVQSGELGVWEVRGCERVTGDGRLLEC